MTRVDDASWIRRSFGGVAVATLLCIGPGVAAGVNEWESGGPYGGFVESLVIDPSTPSTLYAGVVAVGTFEGRVYKSLDGGITWTESYSTSSVISDVVLDPSVPSTLYAATWGEVLKSVDGGESWLNLQLTNDAIRSLAIDPSTPSTLYAGIRIQSDIECGSDGGAVYKSTDGGFEWTLSNDGLPDAPVEDLAVDPVNPSTVYAATLRGVYKSSDEGASWTGAAGTVGAQALAIDPVDPQTIYAASCGEVLKTIDGGATWTAYSEGLSSGCLRSLTIDPADSAILYTGGDESFGGPPRAYQSIDGGVTWSVIAEAPGVVSAVAVSPTNASSLFGYSTVDYCEGAYVRTAGVYRSIDGGASWDVGAAGLNSSVVESLVVDPGTPSTLYAGSFRGGVDKSTDGGVTWFGSGLRSVSVSSLAIDPAQPSTLYAADLVSNHLYKSMDGGAVWALTGFTSSVYSLSVDSSSTVYAGTGSGVFKSMDGGASWLAAREGLTAPGGGYLRVWALAADPTDSGVLYAGTGSGVFQTVDGGGVWTPAGAGLGSGLIRVLVIDPHDPATVYAGSRDGVYKTSDSGGSWTLTGLEDADVMALTLDPSEPSKLYAAGGQGIFRSNDGGGQWIRFDDELPGARRAQVLAVADRKPSVLHAATHGGVYSMTPVEICDDTALCLNNERFRIDLDWRSFDGSTGSGRVVPVGSDDSGLLWFFEASNWEMLIKVLDGCGINDRFWVFAAATTTVEYTLRVTDTLTGLSAEYFNPLGNAAAAITDTSALATCSTASGSTTTGTATAGSMPPIELAAMIPRVDDPLKARSKTVCVPSPTTMCLNGERFQVEVDWRDYGGNPGTGKVVTETEGNDTSGMFWFFNDANWEMLVKVLDGCEVNGRFWLLAAATTDVEYTLRVTDTETGATRAYQNPLGNAAAALVDTFATCPQ